MTQVKPMIQTHMTAATHAIGHDQTLAHAHAVMKRHAVRHLPVLEGGALVGLLSERDLALIETLRDVDPNAVTVEEAMSTEIYAVAQDTPLAQVVRAMAEHRYGCAVVTQNQHVIGIFTTVDACRCLAELLA